MSKYRYLLLVTGGFAVLLVITLVLWRQAVTENGRLNSLIQQETQDVQSYLRMDDVQLPEGVKLWGTEDTNLKFSEIGSEGRGVFEKTSYHALDISGRPPGAYNRLEERIADVVFNLSKHIGAQYRGKANISFAYNVPSRTPADSTAAMAVIRLNQQNGAPQGTITVCGFYSQRDGQIRPEQVTLVIHRAFGPFLGGYAYALPSTRPQTECPQNPQK